MSSTNAALPKISYVKSIDVYLGTCFVMVFASLLGRLCGFEKEIFVNETSVASERGFSECLETPAAKIHGVAKHNAYKILLGPSIYRLFSNIERRQAGSVSEKPPRSRIYGWKSSQRQIGLKAPTG